MQQKKTLPSFTAARSKLALEETTIGERSKQEASSIALSASDDVSADGVSSSPVSQPGRGQQSRGRNGGNKNRNKNSSGNSNGRGQSGLSYGGGRSGNRGGGSPAGGQQRPLARQSWQQPPWWMLMQQPWTSPPCPYPTQAWGQSWDRYPEHPNTGVLGPRPSGPHKDQPQQAYTVAPQWVPTDIEAAMHTMSLSQPDQNWYMDTGATSHMTATQGC